MTVTELLDVPAEVRTAPDGALRAVRLAGRWRPVERVLSSWVVETDWWNVPVRREYRRCLVAGGECVEVSCDMAGGGWRVVRRYD